MDNTSRVAQWRQKMRDEGRESVTLWLSHGTKLRLEDLAATWHTTISDIGEQALEQFRPGSPLQLGNVADTAQLQALMKDTVQALWPGLKQALLQELRGNVVVTAMNGNVTETLHGNVTETIPTQEYMAVHGHTLVTEDAPVRKVGRQPSAERQQILALLADHPEGLDGKAIRALLKAGKPLRHTLHGMKRTGAVQTEGEGKALRYFAAIQ